MILPNFLVVGAAKAGTTSFYHYLKQHPQIYLSSVKETNFFALMGEKANFQGPGDAQKINRTSITDFETYKLQFAEAKDEIAIGEISPLYLYFPSTPERIRQYIPEVKLIAILRNPIDRAYSSFLHLRRDKREPLKEFACALEQEKERIQANWAPLWYYQTLGFYHEQLERYYSCFRANQIRVYLYDNFIQDPLKLIQDMDLYPKSWTRK